MDNYKGYYLNHNSELHSFEGGAHFKYKDLYCKLKKLTRTLSKSRIDNACEEENDNDADLPNFKAKNNIPLSRNAKRIIKSYSQKQIENIEANDYFEDYPQLNNPKPSQQHDYMKPNHHPRTKSEELNPSQNDRINFNFIINNNSSNINNNHEPNPLNVNILNSTRNSLGMPIKSGTNKAINNSIISQQNKLLLPMPNTASASYSTKNIFVKKAIHNKKMPCSLNKVYSNNNNNEQSCLNENNCTYIKDKMDDCYNKLIKINSNNGNTIIIKPQINFSFVNNINAINIQHQLNESRNKPIESSNYNLLSKNNYMSMHKEGMDNSGNGNTGNNNNKINNESHMLSNIQIKQTQIQMPSLKKTYSNFDIRNGYTYKTSKANQYAFKQAKKSSPLKKPPLPNTNSSKAKETHNAVSQSNFFIKTNTKTDSKLGLTRKINIPKKEIVYQSKDIISINPCPGAGVGVGVISNNNTHKNSNTSSTNIHNISNVSSTRNRITFSKNMSDYAVNKNKMNHYLSKSKNLF